MNVDFEGKTISREEVEKQVKQDIANQLGVDSFDELSQSKLEQDMLDKGLDPDIALPILKELLKKDPEYQAAMKYKGNYDKLVQDSARAADIAALNAKFGTKFEKYEDIPENVRQLADKGVSLEKAYLVEAADNNTEDRAAHSAALRQTVSHIVPPTGAGPTGSAAVDLDPEQIRKFKRLNPNATDEQIANFVKGRK